MAMSIRVPPVLSAALLAVGCATLRAPVQPNGQKVAIFLLSDRGNPAAMDELQGDEQGEAGEFMEKDLIGRLEAAGYSATQIQDRAVFKPGQGNYLLHVVIKGFVKGSRSAEVQLGIGWAEMDTYYELSGNGVAPLASDTLTSKTQTDFPAVNPGMPEMGAPDWRDCVRRNNQYTVEGVTKRLRKEYTGGSGR
jgi:hypothetical protein